MNKIIIALILVLVVIGAYFAYTTIGQSETPEEPETQTVEAYFRDSQRSGQDCSAVFPVEREIEKTKGVGKAALKELLKGPTEEEAENGYTSTINLGTELNSLVIEDGTAKADFSNKIEEQVGGSCRITAIKAQIKETLKQFPTVDEVEISVEGETETALQP